MIPCFQLQKPFSAASTNIFLSRRSWGSQIPPASDLVPSIIAKFCEREGCFTCPQTHVLNVANTLFLVLVDRRHELCINCLFVGRRTFRRRDCGDRPNMIALSTTRARP